MRRRIFSSLDYQPLLRRAGILAAISLALALALISFLFEVDSEFLERVLGAFFVFFWLLAVTFLGVVPFVSWVTAHWFGKGWTGANVALGWGPPSGSAAATVRKPVRTAARPTNHKIK